MDLLFLALLVLIMAVALGSGFPVAFALPGSAILSIGLAAAAGYLFAADTDAFFHSGGPSQWLSAGVTNLRGVYWEVERDTLIAIPLFIFMGIMLQRSRIAEDLLVTMAQLFGPVPGGLGISVVFVGALLAATTGIVGATVVAMGLISLPAMLRNRYSPSLATGTIAASGTLGQIIPPSIVLIILADQLASATDQASTARKVLYKDNTGELTMPSAFDVSSTSAGEMFLGAFIPGLVLVGLYMVFILGAALLRPTLAPAVPYDGARDRHFVGRVLLTLVPPLTLIFLVLGSIISGIATVNQAGAIGAVGALVMAGYRLYGDGRLTYVPALLALSALAVLGYALANYEMNLKAADSAEDYIGILIGVIGSGLLMASLLWSGWRVFRIDRTLHAVMLETAKTTSLVFIILLGAAMLTAAFRAFGGEELVRDFLQSLPGGFWAQFVIVMAVIFVLGFFLDFIEIAVVVVPIVAPILLMDPSANVTAVWLGVMIGLNIQTSFLTPPFGFALFYLRGVASAAVRTVQMYKGVIAFILLQLLALAIVGLAPSLVNYLPNRLSLLAETAPPPINPRLQACIEDYVFAEYEVRRPELDRAIAAARALDSGVLPQKTARQLVGAVDGAADVFALVEAVRAAKKETTAAAIPYAPLHREVRALQREIRRDRAIHARLIQEIGRTERRGGEIDALKAEAEQLEREAAALETRIPARWAAESKAFQALRQAELKAEQTYRRSVDQTYDTLAEIIELLRGAEALAATLPAAQGLGEALADLAPKAASEQVREVERALGTVASGRALRSQLSKVRKALSARKPDPVKAESELQTTLQQLRAEILWRQEAATALLPGLERFEEALRGTVGLRRQPRLPRDVALEVAACSAEHRSLALYF